MPPLELPTITAVYCVVVALAALVAISWHRSADSFNLQDVVCTWDNGKRIVSTSKVLLVGSFIVSSYYLIRNPGGTEYAAFLAAWVINGGVVAWRKTKADAAKKET